MRLQRSLTPRLGFPNPRRGSRSGGPRRRGAIAVFAALMLMFLLATVAFAVDLGYLTLAKTEAQRTADATAHAAALEFARTGDVAMATAAARRVSQQFNAENPVLDATAEVVDGEDIAIGYYQFGSGQTDLDFTYPDSYNAVRVRIRRQAGMNGEVPFFLGHLLGKESQAIEVTATAALVRHVAGFKTPPNGGNVPMLPITVSEESWLEGLGAGGVDDWSFDAQNSTIESGSDGLPEIVLFPNKTGSAGNLGTVNIGISANSTSHLAEQVRNGLSHDDLDFHGGEIKLDRNGKLSLTGDPGLSASLKDDVSSIAGKPRVIPLYRKVQGDGDNAVFTIVKFVGVRVMHVNLTGGQKRIIIQPASAVFDGVIQSETQGSSDHVYSPPRLVF